MKYIANIISIFILSSLLISCGELSGSNTGANLLPNSAELVGGLDAVKSGDKRYLLSGTVDNGGNSGHNFRTKFKLNNGETIKFYFFASKKLSGGVVYTFTRTNGVVTLEMTLNGLTDTVELTQFENIEIIDLDIDIHNDHTDIHHLVWDYNGEHSDAEECTFDGDCLYNSEDFAFDVWLGVGRASGTFWGFEGDKSQVIILEGPLEAISNA